MYISVCARACVCMCILFDVLAIAFFKNTSLHIFYHSFLNFAYYSISTTFDEVF